MASEGDTLSPQVREYLSDRYHSLSFPASFSGAQKFYNAVKQEGLYNISLKSIKRWLQSVDTYTVHKDVRRKFPRSRVITNGINDLFDMDLVYMTDLKKYNRGYAYIFLIIDVFSHFAYGYPLRSKKPEEVIAALKKLFKTGNIPTNARSDFGGEFVSAKTRRFLKDHNVNFFTTKNYDVKSNYVERLAKTIKKRLSKYMYSKQTYKWVEALPKIIQGYNDSVHSSIKIAPSAVNEANEAALWRQQYLPPKDGKQIARKEKPFKFQIGDVVRVAYNRARFQKYYQQTWSDQLYIISKRFRRDGIPVYKILNYDRETEVDGTFYTSELQKISISPDTLYKVEKVIKKKTQNGKRYSLVKWLGWDDQYNSWVQDGDLKRFSNK